MSLRTWFVGRRGLRAGWRLLIFVVLFGALQSALQVLTLWSLKRIGFVPPDHLDALDLSIADAVALVATVLATLVMARLEKRSFADYGLPVRRAFSGMFWCGGVFGFAAFSLLIGLIALRGGYSPGNLALGGNDLLRSTLVWAAAAIFIGFAEEYLFRGYLQFTLGDAIGFWPAALLISLAFGALHYFTKPHERWTDWASTSLLALLVCLMLRRTGDLRFAIGFHAAFDYAAIFVYSGPNGGEFAPDRLLQASFHGPDWLTGGPLGPEASLFVFPIIALSFVVVSLLFPETRFWLPEERQSMRRGSELSMPRS